jgi:hypothetical protein
MRSWRRRPDSCAVGRAGTGREGGRDQPLRPSSDRFDTPKFLTTDASSRREYGRGAGGRSERRALIPNPARVVTPRRESVGRQTEVQTCPEEPTGRRRGADIERRESADDERRVIEASVRRLIEVEAQPPVCRPPVATRILARDERGELERLRQARRARSRARLSPR